MNAKQSVLDAWLARTAAIESRWGAYKPPSADLSSCLRGLLPFTSLANSSIPASRFFLITLKTQRTIAEPGRLQPILVTTVLITPTAHSRCVRGGVISMTTMAESSAPPAASPAALNAAAPATPLLVGPGMVNLQKKEPARGGFNRGKKPLGGGFGSERPSGRFGTGRG